MSPSRIIEKIIEDAIRQGDFDDLPGSGKPLDLSAYFNTPEELRLAYTILKNASVLPREAELLKEIAALREQLDQTVEVSRRKDISKAIQDRLLKYHILLERQEKKHRW